MKRSKRLFLLLGVLGVLSLATLGLLRTEEKKEQIKTSGEIILEIDSDSVQTLSWENGSEDLAFHREEGWVYDTDPAFPVSGEKMEELLEIFRQFGVSFVIEGVEDMGQYGLAKPVCTIRVGTEERSWEITLGDYSTMDSERYVSIGDGNVYLAKVDPLDFFDATIRDMIDHDDIPSIDQAEQLTFAGTENYAIVFNKDSTASICAEDVYFTQRDGLPLDTTRVNSYLRAIRNLDRTDYVTYNATPEELKQYGLDNPELTITVDYTREENGKEVPDTFVLFLSRDPAELAAKKDTEDEETGDDPEEKITAYARIGDSLILYQIASDHYTRLMAAAYDELRHTEVFTGDFADVQTIDISLEGKVHRITTEKKGEDHLYYYQDEEIDVSDFQNAMSKVTAVSFTKERPSQQEEIGLTIYLENEEHPQVSIQLYRYNGTQCLAVIDGTPVSLVERSAVVDLMESVQKIILG